MKKNKTKFISAAFTDWTCSVQLLYEEQQKVTRNLKLTPIILDSFKHLKKEKFFFEYAFEILDDIFQVLPYIPKWFIEDKLVSFDKDYKIEIEIFKKQEMEKIKNIDIECEAKNSLVNEFNKKMNKLMSKKFCFFRNYRIDKISDKKMMIEAEVDVLTNSKKFTELELNKTIIELRRQYDNKKIKFVDFCEEKNAVFNETNKSDYIPLKEVFASTFDGVKGCFVVRNKEYNVSYPFKTTNLLKDLKKLFDVKTLKPLHNDFIKLYNSSTLKDKSNIYDIKIIYCQSNKEIEICYRKLKED